jgi:hypothetical protein
VTLSEFLVEVSLLGTGPAGVRLVSTMPAEAARSPLDEELTQLLRAETAGCEVARGNGLGKARVTAEWAALCYGERPDEAIADFRARGATTVLVEYSLDFDLFFPFVPLFLPWERVAQTQARAERDALWNPPRLEAAKQQIDNWLAWIDGIVAVPRAAFITVTQRSAGVDLPKNHQALLRLAAKTIVLNAAGGGDVPIPLLARVQSRKAGDPPWPSASGTYSFRLSDTSNPENGQLRRKMRKAFELHPAFAGAQARASAPLGTWVATHYLPEGPYHGGTEDDWRRAMLYSALQLAPGGTNPSSFRVYEALQLGLVPVYVWDDDLYSLPALPYQDFGAPGVLDADGRLVSVWAGAGEQRHLLWHMASVVIPFSQFNDFLTLVPHLVQNKTWLEAKGDFAKAARGEYFTYEAVMRHVWRLLDDPRRAELKCGPPSGVYF